MTLRRASVVLLFAAACSKPTSGATLAKDPAAEQACKDAADAVAKAQVRCGFSDYRAGYDAFVRVAANGDCASVLQIRDMDGLRKTCLPSLEGTPGSEAMSCADLQQGKLIVECRSQLIHRSVEPALAPASESPLSVFGGDLEE
jgi:hypothetical protein